VLVGSAQDQDEQDVQQAVQDGLLAGRRLGEFAGDQGDDVVDLVVR